MTTFGRAWEGLKAFGVILWPIRFVLAVLLAMVGVLCLPQAQDALYGAVIEGPGSLPVFASVVAWAVQSWYWSRFLYSLPLRGFPARLYGGPPFGVAFADPLITWIPRALGAIVFVIVGVFVLVASSGSADGWLWAGFYVFCGAVFLGLTMARRWLLDVEPFRLPAIPAGTSRTGTVLVLVWLVLLMVAAASTVIDYRLELVTAPGFYLEARQVVGGIIVIALAVTTGVLLLHLPVPTSTRWFVAIMTVVNTALFLLSIFAATWTGMRLGPAVALMLSAGIWVGATSFFLAFPGERLRMPATTLLVIMVLVFTFAPKYVPAWFGHHAGDYDNHRLRTMAAMPLLGQAEQEQDRRATLFEAFEAWREQAPYIEYKPGAARMKPMVLVAAQGGASRSGYWVATILGALEDALAANDAATKSPFHKSVFAISGVSGGSLGAAVYQRLVARKQSGGTPLCNTQDGASDSFSACGQAVIAHDFLGPVFFSMFNADLLQRLLPGDVMADRGEALETAWELAWNRVAGTSDFAEILQVRAKDQLADWLPVLILNGASVKTGRRIVTADVAFQPNCQSSDLLYEGADLPSAVDFFCLTRRQIRLSTAVHNSARFPYISPAGTLWADDGAGRQWKADRIVDGGYVEAQGATTLLDLLLAIDAGWKQKGNAGDWRDEILPIVISIQNDPPEGGRECTPPADGDFRCQPGILAQTLGDEASAMGLRMQAANDLLAPPIGLASSRTGRGAYAARALAVRMYYEGLGRRPDDRRNEGWSVHRVNLGENQGPAPAMSWFLSRRSQSDMASDLCEEGGTEPGDRSAKAELDDTLRKLGKEFQIDDLPRRIRDGSGCVSLRKQALPAQ